MVTTDSVVILQKKLADWRDTLPSLKIKLLDALQCLPENPVLMSRKEQELQKQIKLSLRFCAKAEAEISDALSDPVRSKDLDWLAHMDNEAITTGQAIGFCILLAEIYLKQKREKVESYIRGDWSLDTLLPVDGEMRKRLASCLLSVSSFATDFMQMRDPAKYSWKAYRTIEEIGRLEEAAKELEAELSGLLSLSGSTIAYGRYLKLETILSSYEYFEAYALSTWFVHGQDGRLCAQLGKMQ